MSSQIWFIYIIRAADNTLYTGVTTDVARRFEQHGSGKGAKYLKGRSPIELVFKKEIGTRSEAQRLEHWVKQQSKQDKERIIKKQISLSI